MQPSAHEPAPRAGPVPGVLGSFASRAYAAVINHRNRRFDAGRGVTTLPLPVISVGNLSVGGTGKTPMVAYLCRVLLEQGLRPCIAMRGYAAKPRAGEQPASDEADVYRREFGESVDVVAQPDRAGGVRTLLASTSTPPHIIVLDDGFQHRRIRRDLDIVLIDASRDPFTDRLLPAGWLREPAASLKRASCTVLMHAELAPARKLDELRQNILRIHGHRPIATTRHLWMSLLDAESHALPLDWLLGKRTIGVCAIGNPQGFVDALKATLGSLPPAEVITLPDHDPYAPATLRRIVDAAARTGATGIVVTDKDWSKLRRIPASTWPCPIVRPVLALEFLDGKSALEHAVLDASAAAPAPAR